MVGSKQSALTAVCGLFLALLLNGCGRDTKPASNAETTPDTEQTSIAERPNIVIIIADDVSWDDLGAYGHPTVKTPNIDQLAQKGVLFNAAYLTASSCSPSRASILSGRYPHNTDAEQLHWDMPGNQTLFTTALREAGYWTGAAGKWHLGAEVATQVDLLYEFDFPSDFFSAGSDDWLRLMRDRPDDKPFFLWLASWDAHRPFKEGVIEDRHTKEDVVLPPYYPETDLYLEDFALYYDDIGHFDEDVGMVLAELKAQGVADNTLVIIMADNGRPYARDKTTMYDSGMKTPFIVHWPGVTPAGGVSNSILSVVDIAPTMLELAGAEPMETLEGESFVPLLTAPQTPFRDYAASERNWHDYDDLGRTIRTANFRYIRNYYPDLPATPSADTTRHETWWQLVRLNEEGQLSDQQRRPLVAPRPEEELYDLRNDPLELNNLAGDPAHAGILETHRTLLAQWREETGDFIPSRRTPDEFDRLTGEYLPNRVRPRQPKAEMIGASGAY